MSLQPSDRQVRLLSSSLINFVYIAHFHDSLSPWVLSLLTFRKDISPLFFSHSHISIIHHRKYSSEAKLKTKQVDDVLGGADAWEDVDRVKTKCPFCDGEEAFFMQIQIRSADEPMTIFYKCCSCMKQWNQ